LVAWYTESVEGSRSHRWFDRPHGYDHVFIMSSRSEGRVICKRGCRRDGLGSYCRHLLGVPVAIRTRARLRMAYETSPRVAGGVTADCVLMISSKRTRTRGITYMDDHTCMRKFGGRQHSPTQMPQRELRSAERAIRGMRRKTNKVCGSQDPGLSNGADWPK